MQYASYYVLKHQIHTIKTSMNYEHIISRTTNSDRMSRNIVWVYGQSTTKFWKRKLTKPENVYMLKKRNLNNNMCNNI